MTGGFLHPHPMELAFTPPQSIGDQVIAVSHYPAGNVPTKKANLAESIFRR
jgi:hypothetical protein